MQGVSILFVTHFLLRVHQLTQIQALSVANTGARVNQSNYDIQCEAPKRRATRRQQRERYKR